MWDKDDGGLLAMEGKDLAHRVVARVEAAGRWLRQDVAPVEVIELLAVPPAISLFNGLVRLVNSVFDPKNLILGPRATRS